jgi:uncharacterized membrane protein (DUF2068 family)
MGVCATANSGSWSMDDSQVLDGFQKKYIAVIAVMKAIISVLKALNLTDLTNFSRLASYSSVWIPMVVHELINSTGTTCMYGHIQ